ncbi:unnamed protein product [Prunus brigantina]
MISLSEGEELTSNSKSQFFQAQYKCKQQSTTLMSMGSKNHIIMSLSHVRTMNPHHLNTISLIANVPVRWVLVHSAPNSIIYLHIQTNLICFRITCTSTKSQ